MARRRYAIPQYGTVVMAGTEYYRTRIEDADGKQYCKKWWLMQSAQVPTTALTDYRSNVKNHIIKPPSDPDRTENQGGQAKYSADGLFDGVPAGNKRNVQLIRRQFRIPQGMRTAKSTFSSYRPLSAKPEGHILILGMLHMPLHVLGRPLEIPGQHQIYQS